MSGILEKIILMLNFVQKIMACHSLPLSSWRMITRLRYKMLVVYIMSWVCLGLELFFRLPFCIYRVACVALAHSRSSIWKNIFITHLIIIKSEISTFPIVVIFFRGCVSQMVVLSYSVMLHIYPGNTGTLFPLLIWRHWTTKMLVRYMLPSVYLRLRQFSPLSFIQYMGLCVFSLPNSPVMIVRMCILCYYHHQTGSMNH